MSDKFGILIGQCTVVFLMLICCIYFLVILPFTDRLIGMGINVGLLLLIGGITLCCKKCGMPCDGTETLPTIRVQNYRIVDI